MFDFNKSLPRTRATHLPRIKCADGFVMSVQASASHYCSPRESGLSEYTAVEVGFPSQREEALMEYAENGDVPTETVYGWVPVEVVNAIVNAHGGAERWAHFAEVFAETDLAQRRGW